MRRLAALALVPLIAAAEAPTPAKPQTPGEILAAAPQSDWRPIAADDLLVVEFKDGKKVVIQLAPEFAPVHVANIKALAKAGYWQGAALYRVHDNYVAQWGNNETEKPLPAGVVAQPPAEYFRALAGLDVTPLGSPDPYEPLVGYAAGWAVAVDTSDSTINLAHCYGSVGVGRNLSPDTGMGGELYAVIGQGPRALDRVIANVGRVVGGIENLSSLPRGTEALGFYKERSMDVPIASVRLASAMPEGERPKFEYLDEKSGSFAAWLKVKKNRRDDFYIHPAGGVDLCNATVPVRAAG
ncbi:peptidylprolyl isomerase [Sphingomonas sp. RB56-2]|uniref:Peptidylprolyl isomerase n=1 Tax=Sphingomonas brevis TaxID=2908206 RepID=A0ABT0SBF1_9SPHN|nr:peptidylprolyl isomerase [Sphingomonas brevis]MCL6741736.1 peptidylprolyl isomerase [Sphingomonas brevis]